MRPMDEVSLAKEVKYRIVQLNRSYNLQQIKGIMGLIKFEVGVTDKGRVLYYGIERSLSPESKKIIGAIIKQAANSLKLTTILLFT